MSLMARRSAVDPSTRNNIALSVGNPRVTRSLSSPGERHAHAGPAASRSSMGRPATRAHSRVGRHDGLRAAAPAGAQQSCGRTRRDRLAGRRRPPLAVGLRHPANDALRHLPRPQLRRRHNRTYVLEPDFDSVLVRDGWVVYRGFDGAVHQTCVGRKDAAIPTTNPASKLWSRSASGTSERYEPSGPARRAPGSPTGAQVRAAQTGAPARGPPCQQRTH